jgi:hypothetical protein
MDSAIDIWPTPASQSSAAADEPYPRGQWEHALEALEELRKNLQVQDTNEDAITVLQMADRDDELSSDIDVELSDQSELTFLDASGLAQHLESHHLSQQSNVTPHLSGGT